MYAIGSVFVTIQQPVFYMNTFGNTNKIELCSTLLVNLFVRTEKKLTERDFCLNHNITRQYDCVLHHICCAVNFV
jgi:hypothetical protein